MRRRTKLNRSVILLAFSLFPKIIRLTKWFNYLRQWELDIQQWWLVQLEQEKVQWLRSWRKWKVQQYTVSIPNQSQFLNFMVKCILKQDSGQMVFFPKLSGLLTKKHQEEKRNPDGYCMMVTLMPFGSRIWTLSWMIIDCWLWSMVIEFGLKSSAKCYSRFLTCSTHHLLQSVVVVWSMSTHET